MPSRDTSNTRLRDRRSTPQVDPARTAQGSAAVKDETKKKTFMDQWVEPTVASQPSYQDHKGNPYGVVEHMQPLGEAPSQKVKARVRSEAPRKSVLGRSSAAAGVEFQETPEGTPAPQPASSPHVNGATQPPIVIDDEKDADYAPGVKKKDRSTRSRTTHRRSEPTPATPAAGMATPTPTDMEPKKSKSSAKKERVYDPDKLKRVVEAAEKRANECGKPDLAAAVHEIWVESLKNGHLTDLLEAILLQSASAAQTEEFQNFVKRAKQRLKDAKGKSRKNPAKGANGSQALPLRSPSKFTPPTPAADVQLPATAIQSTEASEVARPKLSIKVKSPSKETNGHRRSGHGGKMTVSPPKHHQRAGSESSALTELTSEGEDAMDVDEPDELASGPPPPSVKINGAVSKDHAAKRGSLAAPDRKLKRSSADADVEDEERDRLIAAKKQKLNESVKREVPFEESDMRGNAREAPQERTARTKNSSLVPPPLTLAPTASRVIGARVSRGPSTEVESPLSELSPNSSRMSTPRTLKAPPRPPAKRAKTKTSPEKKHLAGYGGLSGAGGAGRESPIGDDDNEELSENNDFCSACGGSGFLLCCDGCDRSFHFSCLDPPLNEDASELNEPWYCFKCVARRPIVSESPEKPLRGLFAPLLSSLKKRNPSNYALPQELREHYEGVQADKNGNFVEAVQGRTRNRTGYDEQPDYYKLKDSKGNTVICYHCNRTSQGQPARPVIQCDYCGESWHLDCLDPPLANPPARSLEGKKIHDWMCPLHADQELRGVDTSLLAPRRKVHVRRPRNARVVDTSLTRGFQNNGVVDVLDDDSDDSEAEFYDEETPDEAVIYRMPASGIKLDFIDKVKSTRVQEIRNERAYKHARLIVEPPSALQQANFARRSFAEQQLALNLAQFASENRDLELGSNQVENLVGALIAEAPSEVVDEYMAAEDAEKLKSSTVTFVPPSPPSSEQTDQLSTEQRKELEMLQELIKRKLDGSKT